MKRRGFVQLQMIAALGITTVTASVVTPMLTRTRAEESAAVCAHNLQVIGRAMRLYANDWEEKYPTNQGYNPSPTTPPSPTAYLTKPGLPLEMVTYVESLEPYFPAAGAPQWPTWTVGSDRPNIWICPAAKNKFFPWDAGSGHYDCSRVTYAINYGLLEKQRGKVTDPAKTMMFRELGLRGQAYTVAYNATTTNQPTKPFLPDDSAEAGATTTVPIPYLHGYASHILFADGHVQLVQHTLARSANVVHPTERPAAWACCEGADPAKPVIYITP